MEKHIYAETKNMKIQCWFECSWKDVAALNSTLVNFATKTMWMGAFERQLLYRFVYRVDCNILFDIFILVWHKRNDVIVPEAYDGIFSHSHAISLTPRAPEIVWTNMNFP